MRVFLVDAERSLHLGVKMRLEWEPDVALIAEVDTLKGALDKIAEVQPDVVLVDPVGLGADPELVIADLHHACPAASLVVLSLRDDQDSRERVQSAGAAAFVSKHDGADRLLQVIREVGGQAARGTQSRPAS